MFYVIIAGLLIDVPRLPILNETIRNTYYHVACWMAMLILMTVSLVYSIKYLSSTNAKHDSTASAAVNAGLIFGFIGVVTGMVWAQFTWGAFWLNDPKLNGTAIGILVYVAYYVLRGSINDMEKRARISAVYNIFAYVMMMLFIMVLPRVTDSLHPGNGGNPAFSSYDMNNMMKLVFYPAIIAYTLLGVWFIEIQNRIKKIEEIQAKNEV